MAEAELNGKTQEAQGTPAPAKPRGRRPAPKEAAEAGRIWTGERVSVGEGHPAPPETPSSPPVAVVPAGEAKPVPAEGEPHWYVVHAYSGHEEKVRNNLMKRVDSMDMHDRIFEVLVPTEDVIEIKDGQRRHVAKRTFPGYILVNMIMSDESWYVVRNTPGVTSFVGSGNKPVPLQEKEIKSIQKQIKAEAPKVRVEYQVGENVRVIDGPFSDFHGKVDEINADKGKLKVLVNMFGRETPVELDLLQVERLK
ncbi:MAG TPA: transcription termination/antitermination protein NusG [Candidatus Dormibacteraeota bacterium]|nr:transcription termination/antitermination protein NusG [Candidatus Dormibacteraeota bacterium]